MKGFSVEYYERWQEIQALGKGRKESKTDAKAKDWQLVKIFGLGVLDEDNRTVELWETAEQVMGAYEQVKMERMKQEKKHG